MQTDELRALQSAMSDEVLVAKCRAWISKLCSTGGNAWSLRVPVDYENDPDMLFGELCRRVEQKSEHEQKNETTAGTGQ